MMKRSSWEAGEAGLASSSHRWPTQSKLAKMSLAMSPYTSYGSIRVTMKLEVHMLGAASTSARMVWTAQMTPSGVSGMPH